MLTSILAKSRLDRVNKRLLRFLLDFAGIKIAQTVYKYDHIFKKPILNTTLLLPGKGCSWVKQSGGCAMCGFKNALSSAGVNRAFSDTEVMRLFDLGMSELIRKRPKVLNIYNAGSFLNDNEITYELQERIIEGVRTSQDLEVLFVESRPEFITTEKLTSFSTKLNPKTLKIGIGLESSNERIRNDYIKHELFFTKSIKAFSNILQQVKEGGQIAQGIMGFATVSNKGSFERLNIYPLIERALQATRLKHSKTTVEGLINFPLIINHLPEELPLILVNPSQLQDIFFVLSDNALDALEDKSLIQGTSFQGRITVTAKTNSDYLQIYLEDNGTGIRPEHLKRLFLPYFTTKKATDIKGRGLGLSIVKQFVLANKGKLWAESELGYWTKFTVEFPVAK